MGDVFLVGFISLVNISLGSFVLFRNPRHKTYRLFFVFTAALVFWTVLNFLADYSDSHNLLLTRLTLLGGVLIAYSLFEFSGHFPGNISINSSLTRKIQLGVAALTGALSMSSYVVPEVTKVGSRVDLQTGSLYIFYTLFLVQALVFVVINLVRRAKRADKQVKLQIQFLTIAIAIYAVLAIILNAILPVLVDNWASSKFGPLATLFFVWITSYAIVRHGLLDIRVIVARSLGYVLSLGILILAFAFASSLLVENVFRNISEGWVTIAINSFVFLIAVLAYPVLKRYFDRITNKLFYRDAYDPQDFLDNLNTEIVQNIEMGVLLRKVSAVIEQHIKCSYCFVSVFEASGTPTRTIGAEEPPFNKSEVAELRKLVAKSHKKALY